MHDRTRREGVDAGASERESGPDRLVALADGIFAIAMTLLVLNISVPAGLDHAHFTQSMHDAVPRLGAYALSFAIIASIWRDHRRLSRLVHRPDTKVVRLTLAFLGMVALLPFPTALLSGYGTHEPLAITAYAANIAAIDLLLLAVFLVVRRDRASQEPPIPDRLAWGIIADFAGTILIAGATILIAFTVSATAGLYVWVAALPAGLVARRMRRGTVAAD